MIKLLIALLELLTADQSLAELTHVAFRFALANAGIVLVLVSAVIVRGLRMSRTAAVSSRA